MNTTDTYISIITKHISLNSFSGSCFNQNNWTIVNLFTVMRASYTYAAGLSYFSTLEETFPFRGSHIRQTSSIALMKSLCHDPNFYGNTSK